MSAFRQIRWRLVFAVICGFAGAGLGGWAGDQATLASFQQRARDANHQIIDRFVMINRQQRIVTTTLAAAIGEGGVCTPELLREMRILLYEFSALRDIALIKDGDYVCSAVVGRIIPPQKMEEPFMETISDIAYHALEWPPALGRAAIGANFGPFELIYSEQAFAPFDLFGGQISIIIAGRDMEPYTFFGPPISEELAFVEGSRITFEDGVVYAQSCAGGFFVCAVRSELRDDIRAQGWAYIAGGALTGGLFGAFCAVLGLMVVGEILRPEKRALRLLKGGHYHFEYQPIVDLKLGRVIGAEALIRPSRGYRDVPVPVIIDVAERTGRTRRVLERAAEAAVGAFASRLHGGEFRVSVNAAPMDLVARDLGGFLEDLCRKCGAPADSFAIEITERSAVDAPEIIKAVANLRARGFRVAIDDFGAGYANLSYLGALEAHLIKIDRSLVIAAGTGSTRERVLDHILNIARELDMQVLAEGVETSTQAEFFHMRGVDLVQGWLFAKAMSAPDFEAWVEDWTKSGAAKDAA